MTPPTERGQRIGRGKGAHVIFTLLSGAKKNVGDFLIYERCKELIKAHTGVSDFLEIPRWEPLDPVLKRVNESRAVILCGGPGYSPDFYPGIFPLAQHLPEIEVPIVPMGLGWVGTPMKRPDVFRFTADSLEALQHIHRGIAYSSVRDPITEGILRRHGVGNVLMTGGPAWYSLPDLDVAFQTPDEIQRIVLSDPANPRLYGQAIRLMQEMRGLFPDAEGYFVFHRGLRADEHTLRRRAAASQILSVFARILRFRPIDASYGTERIDFYRDVDLHVGYRVHAHLYFLSIRKPSYLIAEDGRGIGQMEGLDLPRITAFDVDPVGAARDLVTSDMRGDHRVVRGAIDRMKETYPVMKQFLTSLP